MWKLRCSIFSFKSLTRRHFGDGHWCVQAPSDRRGFVVKSHPEPFEGFRCSVSLTPSSGEVADYIRLATDGCMKRNRLYNKPLPLKVRPVPLNPLLPGIWGPKTTETRTRKEETHKNIEPKEVNKQTGQQEKVTKYKHYFSSLTDQERGRDLGLRLPASGLIGMFPGGGGGHVYIPLTDVTVSSVFCS